MNMKLSTKPISSPGRTEKFPPPLMRFLRTNVGSKSRGRSRSSPMFVRKKNNNNNTAIETQEPSSPKVTCMGQVRVKRSSKQASNKPNSIKTPWTGPVRCQCGWVPKPLFCHHFAGKLRPKLCKPVWSKWGSFFQLSFRRKVGIRGEQPKEIVSRFEEKNEDSEQEEDEDEDEKKETKVFVSSCISPPKNALLLTRCRSAPYRSSSLASRFWGSPLKSDEEETEQEKQSTELESSKNEKPMSKMESFSDKEARIDPDIEEKLKIFRENFLGSNGKRFSESANTEEEEEQQEESKTGEEEEVEEEEEEEGGGGGGLGRPVILTRCKSEPARTGEKLDPELSFWKNRRLGIVNSCSPSVL